jgi:hypothetical protein
MFVRQNRSRRWGGKGVARRGWSGRWCWESGGGMSVVNERKEGYDGEFCLGENDELQNTHLQVTRCDQTSPKTAMTSPAPIFPSLTSFEPNQNPWMNIAMVTN